MQVSFIGGGVMAEAMVGGITEAHLASPGDIRIGEPLEERRSYLVEKYGVEASANNPDVLEGAEIVVLSVKPQNLNKAMAEIGPALNRQHVVISIVAGARIDTLVTGLKHPAVIRVMPNTPAQIGAGMSVWTSSPEVTEEKVSACRDILRTLGQELYVAEEKLVDMSTAVSASGPAYVFLFIEAMIDAGVYLGIPRDIARTLVLQTVIGSTRLVEETGKHPAELKDMVTSPGGTTAEALLALEEGGFRSAILDAVDAAYEKSIALGQQG